MNTTTIRTTGRLAVPAVVLALALASAVRADGPHVYAITGARVVPVSSPPMERATIVVRGGLIEAVGPAVAVPAGARTLDGRGLTVYPGLIDMGSGAGLDVPVLPEPRNPATRMDLERWKRQILLRAPVVGADHVKAGAPELARLAAAGITSVLVVPPGAAIRGYSSLIDTAIREDDPQIGQVADERRGLHVLQTPVALHIAFADRPPGAAYPESLMGAIAFIRQALADGRHYQLEQAYYSRTGTGARPVHDAALAALRPALDAEVPVALEAGSLREILRALALAKEFRLDPIVVGGLEADQATPDLAAQKARVVYSLDFPTRSRALAPDADEPIAAVRSRANAPKIPAALAKAGIRFAFTSGALREPKDFIRNAARAVKAGLPPDAALRALTIDAAAIAGAAGRVGAIEKGRIANLVVTDGDLFEEKTTIKHVFVDGRPVVADTAPPAGPPARSSPGGWEQQR